MKILLDENISPRLVGQLAGLGISAQHVAHLGLSGKRDAEIFRYAFANDMVVLTINVKDFLTFGQGRRSSPRHLSVARERPVSGRAVALRQTGDRVLARG